MIDYYSMDTSPRKFESDYDGYDMNAGGIATKERPVKKEKYVKNKKKINNQSKAKVNTRETKKSTIKVIDIVICFAVLITICYRYALVNISFEEKENLKKSYAAVQKQNEQLKVTIEQKMNVSTIEQEAKEKLGMQKLDNNQKVYVNLEKSDYIESAVDKSDVNENQTWWSKLLKDLFKIK